MPEVFDVLGERDLFKLVEREWAEYREKPEKSTAQVMAILMILNHLREWIAPQYGPRNGQWPSDDTPEKTFSKQVYADSNFTVIRQLCNGTKHASLRLQTEAEFETYIDGSSPDVRLHLTDVPSGHLVDGKPVEEFIAPVFQMYSDWFARSNPS